MKKDYHTVNKNNKKKNNGTMVISGLKSFLRPTAYTLKKKTSKLVKQIRGSLGTNTVCVM